MTDRNDLNTSDFYDQILEEENNFDPADPCDPSHPDYPWVPCGIKKNKADK